MNNLCLIYVVKRDYLIPANTKKSQLILGFFTKLDLILLQSLK